MMHERPEDLEQKLERIGRATKGVRPSEGFARRVRGAINAERDAVMRRSFTRAGGFTLATAAALALATLAVAAERNQAAVEATAISYGVEDLEW